MPHAMGELLRARLREATAGCPAVREVRGRGCSWASTSRATAPAEVVAVLDRAREDGVLIGTTGPRSTCSRSARRWSITAAQVERVAEVVG